MLVPGAGALPSPPWLPTLAAAEPRSARGVGELAVTLVLPVRPAASSMARFNGTPGPSRREIEVIRGRHGGCWGRWGSPGPGS